ncbi:uncharacterized protein LOC144142395 [Haemaphysalis longicornis]
MSQDVLGTLHSVLRRLTVTELRSLDELHFSWLPSLQQLSLRPAVNTIVGSLQAIESRSKRLEGVALIYAWLLPGYQQPWMLFSVEEASEKLSDFRRLLTKSASALRLHSHEVTLQWTLRDGAVRACVLMKDVERELFAEAQASYVVLWPGLPLLAVQTPGRRARQEFLSALGKGLNGALFRRLKVPRQDLGAAFRAALAFLGLQVEEGTPGVPAMAIPPSHDTGPDLLALDVNDEETKERLAEWEAALAELGLRLRPVEHGYKITGKFGSTRVSFDGPDLLEKLRRLYACGFKEMISPAMLPAFLGKDSHVVADQD